jgi:hypothetical protein
MRFWQRSSEQSQFVVSLEDACDFVNEIADLNQRIDCRT